MVGGNVLTSQRVTDVVLKAFAAAAASQVPAEAALDFISTVVGLRWHGTPRCGACPPQPHPYQT